ncbi:O-antigen polymerase [Ignavibacterium album JCM 16511]|uniref:O-antigen polymerase n=2 Tax=Ignavibacterium album TaxID=591197 RepID=I0AHJ4_IGNAJ|nr:O-antigen polymerase [Ignavibacterium album JCM 16511]
MSVILVLFFLVSGIIGGRYIFKAWMNSLTVYSFVMGGLTFLYELKLLPYPELSFISWFYIISSSIAFFIGIISVIFAKKLFPSRAENLRIKVSDMPIFKDDGKVLKYSVIFFSLVGLFVALHRWYIMINIFGSIPSVFINAAWVYRINVKGEIKEFIPILPSFVYVGVFLSAIYTAYRGKFSFLSFFPIICIILKELTYFGRGEMLFSTLEFLFTFFLFRNLLNREDIKFKFSRKNAGFAILLLIILVITAASVVRTSRGIKENFRGATKELKQLEENLILTPSVYFYLSSDLGVLNQYLFKETEEANFGENTFRGVYYLLSKIKIVDEPPFFQKGYFIPFWSNTGTFIREIHADFGLLGVILVPFFLGVLLTYLWFRFFEEKNLIVLTVLVYLNLIIAFSFLVMVTRLNQWFLSQFLIILFLPVINKLASKKILN